MPLDGLLELDAEFEIDVPQDMRNATNGLFDWTVEIIGRPDFVFAANAEVRRIDDALFAKLVDQSKGTQQVTVSSAAALPAAEQDRIKGRLRETLKREVEVTFHTDATHLAGLRIHIGSTVVDSTVRGRLNAMQSLLTRD